MAVVVPETVVEYSMGLSRCGLRGKIAGKPKSEEQTICGCAKGVKSEEAKYVGMGQDLVP